MTQPDLAQIHRDLQRQRSDILAQTVIITRQMQLQHEQAMAQQACDVVWRRK